MPRALRVIVVTCLVMTPVGCDALRDTVGPGAADAPAVVAGPDELEIFDVEIEWTPIGGGHYGGYGHPPDMLRVVAKGRTRRAVGPKAEVAIKATCDDAGVAISETETARIDDAPGGAVPLVGTEFRVGPDLFTRARSPRSRPPRRAHGLRGRARGVGVVRAEGSGCRVLAGGDGLPESPKVAGLRLLGVP